MLRQTPATFSVGEAVHIGFSASQDAYLYLLDVNTEGTVSVIFLNGERRENRVYGKQRYFLPREDEAVELPVEGPPGVETLIAIAAVQPVPVLAEWQENEAQPSRSMSQQDLSRVAEALSRLPRNQRAVGQCQFVVRE